MTPTRTRTPTPIRTVDRVLGAETPLVLLLAPAGFGKSALLRRLADRAGDDARLIVAGPGPTGIAPVLDALADPTTPTVLVDSIDTCDGELLPPLADAIARRAATGGRVVLASRVRLDLPIRRWQLAGRAEVVTADRLGLDREEIGDALGIDGHDLDRAVDSTGGWPSAVALLAQQLRDRPLDEALTAAREDHLGYITEEALAVLAPDELELLQKLTVIDRLDADVVASIAGDEQGPARLWDVVERTQLFTVDEGTPAWREDVREALARELRRTRPASIRDHHLAAARAMTGDSTVARLRHLIEAQAWDEAVVLVTEHWRRLRHVDHTDLVVDALIAMPIEYFSTNPAHSLGAGGLLLTRGHHSEAERFLDAPCVAADPAARATAAALRAYATWWSVAPEHALSHLDLATAYLDGDPSRSLIPTIGFEPMTTGRSMLTVSRARAHALLGDVGRAAELLQELPLLPIDDPVADSVSAWATKAWVDALAGNVQDAKRACDLACNLAGSGGWLGTPSQAPALLARSLVSALTGPSDQTWADVADASEIATRSGAWALLGVCRSVAAMCGDSRRALPGDHLDAAATPLTDQLLGAWRSRDAARRGDVATAVATLAVTEPIELALGAWVEAALHTTRPAPVLPDLPPATTATGRIARDVAAAALATEPAARDEHLRSALLQARRSGLTGALRQTPHQVWSALVDLAADDDTIAELASPPPRTTQDDLVPELSERELEIVRLLDGPATVADIGRTTFLSGHTVKWYIARIYRKLDVHSRVEAVNAARALGLM